MWKKHIQKTILWKIISPLYYKYIYPLYNYIGTIYYKVENYICRKKYEKEFDLNPYNIPIIINNFNRLSYLKLLIKSLEERGYTNIYIIDNNSTYPPLIEFYNTCNYHVFRLKKNVGFCAIWKTGIYNKFKHSYYVYTDSDMQIDEICPSDFMHKFIQILEDFPLCQKVGFGLKIDDLPNCYNMRNEVIKHEFPYWQKEISDNLYDATIDTTFALYRPYTKGPANKLRLNIRTGKPYLIKHLPWYIDSNNLSEEEIYYINHVKQSTYWTKKFQPLS